MKIVVIGGTGLIGSKVVANLKRQGHDVLAASPGVGINAVTGEGLAGALAGAQVVVDVANSPSFEDRAVMQFFESAGRNLMPAEKAAGVKHHVALSIVNADRTTDSGYMRAKVVQEKLIVESGVPYTIVRATQFFEFLGAIAASGGDGTTLRLPTAPFQPIAADDVAAILTEVALAAPANKVIDIAGPEKQSLADFIGRFLAASRDLRTVVADPHARYFDAALDDRGLAPAGAARIGATKFDDWFSRSAARK